MFQHPADHSCMHRYNLSILDESILDESILDESILDESILDGYFQQLTHVYELPDVVGVMVCHKQSFP